ncbi:MAG TPA: glycosyltransferase family 39 protein [Bacteroidales bacterium]
MKTIIKPKISRESLLILIFTLFTFAFHLLTALNYGLHRDEYLYLAFSKHPDWGYFSVPPLIGVFSKLIYLLFNGSVLGVRFFPALTGALTVMIIGLITKRLGGKAFAITVASLAYILSPSYLRVNTLFQPVTFEQFLWILAVYVIFRLIIDGNPKLWLWFGLVMGIAILNKYLVGLYAACLLLSMLLLTQRKYLFTRYFLIAAGIGLIIIFPNLVWQYNHNFPIFTHLAELNKYQLQNVKVSEFLFMQLGMHLPGVIVWITGLIGVLFYSRMRDLRAIGLTFIFGMIALILFKGKGYYTLGLFLPLFAIGGERLEAYWRSRKTLRYGLVVLMFLLALPMVPYSIPVLSYPQLEKYAGSTGKYFGNLPLIWEDGKVHPIPQDFADMTGWNEVGRMAVQSYLKLDENTKKHCGLYGDNYGQAGAIMYASRGMNLPEPLCFSDNFMFWAPDSLTFNSVIYIDDNIDDEKKLFHHIDTIGTIRNKYFRENGVSVLFMSEPTDSLRKVYDRKIVEIRKVYFRK